MARDANSLNTYVFYFIYYLSGYGTRNTLKHALKLEYQGPSPSPLALDDSRTTAVATQYALRTGLAVPVQRGIHSCDFGYMDPSVQAFPDQTPPIATANFMLHPASHFRSSSDKTLAPRTSQRLRPRLGPSSFSF